MLRRAIRPSILRLAVVAALTLLLGACTIYLTDDDASVRTSIRGRITFGVPLQEVITRFEPSRGAGSSYRVGEEISFRVRTSRDGYLTLTAIDPDGFVYTFARNIFVEGGRTQTISGPDRRHVFVLEPPRGLHRVRASFTAGRTDASRVRYRDQRGEEAWTQSIVVDVRDSDTRDVVETHFYVR